MSGFHGGPPPPPSSTSGAETTLGIFRAEDYGASPLKADSAGGINLAAFIAASSGGGIVQLDSGRTYRVRQTVTLPTGVELVIPAGTVLQGAAGLAGDVVASATGATSGVRITGGGTIDGNRASGQSAGNGVTLTSVVDSMVAVRVINAFQDGVALVGCSRITLDVQTAGNGRHGVYHSASTFCLGRVVSRDNGQRVAGHGVVFDAASTDNTYAPLVATDTRAGGAKTQQYGVLEVAASGSDRNTYAGYALGGNAAGTSSLVGASSGPFTGPVANAALAGYPWHNADLTTDVARSNQLVNGGLEIWQRGAGPFTANNAYTADRWQISLGGTSTLSVAKDTTNQDAGSQACAALTYVHNAESFLLQAVGGTTESIVWQMRGRTLSASVRVRSAVANAVRLRLSDGVTTTYGAYHSGSGLYETLTVTKAFANTATAVQLALSLNASGTFYVDNAMLVTGAVAADYVPRPDADELARCLRYYEIVGEGADVVWTGNALAATNFYHTLPWKARKAVTPTLTKVGTWNVTNCAQPSLQGGVSNLMLFSTVTANGFASYSTAASTFATGEANP